MKKIIDNDITGLKFNRLTAISETDEVNGQGAKLWLCECECGNPRKPKVSRGDLMRGNSKSCGCLRAEKAGQRKFKDLLGKRFGKLVAIELMPTKTPSGASIWKCQCDCGDKSFPSSQGLLSGNSTTCGCTRQIKRDEARARDEKFLGKPTSKFKKGDVREDGFVFLHRVTKGGYTVWISGENYILYKIKNAIRGSIRGGITRNFKKTRGTEDILCLTIGETRDYIASLFAEGMTWENHGEWEIDHIIAMNYIKTQDDKVFAAEVLNHFSNLQPLWKADNIAKFDHLPQDADAQYEVLKQKVLEYRSQKSLTK